MLWPGSALLILIAAGNTGGTGQVFRPPPPVFNMIPNPSVEVPDNSNGSIPKSWYALVWGDSVHTFDYLTTGYDGQRSVRVGISTYTSGGAGWNFNAVKVTPGRTYQYSDYYQSNVPSIIEVTEIESDGTQHLVRLFPAPPAQQWTHYVGTFTTDANAVSVSVCHEITSVGSLTTDDFDLIPVNASFKRPLISLTFDDSYQNFCDAVLPALQQHGMTATQYAISGLLGHKSYLTVAELGSLQASGIEVGAHTVTHPDLTTVIPSSLDTELSVSQSSLVADIGAPVPNFATPYGSYNDLVLSRIPVYYRSHRTLVEGYNGKVGFDPYRIRVEQMNCHTTIAQVQQWINTCLMSGTWLVFVHHCVDSTGAPGSITPAIFDSELAAIAQSGIHTCTVNAALDEITSQ